MDPEKSFYCKLAAAILAAGFIYVFMVTFVPIPETGTDHAKVALGFMLGSVIGTIIGFAYGSSKGSRDKDPTPPVTTP